MQQTFVKDSVLLEILLNSRQGTVIRSLHDDVPTWLQVPTVVIKPDVFLTCCNTLNILLFNINKRLNS